MDEHSDRRKTDREWFDKIVIMSEKIDYLVADVKDIKISLIGNYITKTEFDLRVRPLERIVSIVTYLIFAGIAGAILTLVLKK